jgi:hypothetical protein
VVRACAQPAIKAGAIAREEGMLVPGVKGFSRASAAIVDDSQLRDVPEITARFVDNQRRIA